MQKIYTKLKQSFFGLFFVVFLSTMLTSVLLPSQKASAAALTNPLVWDSNTHNHALDASGTNVFSPVGYACVDNTTPITSSSGSAIDPQSQPKGGKIGVTSATETGSNSSVMIPSCTNLQNNQIPASYVWVSTNSPQYMLVVSSPVTGPMYDPRYCPVNSKCQAYTAEIQNGRQKSSSSFINYRMAVDTSKTQVASTAPTLANLSSGSSASSATPTCESSNNPLNWLLCSVFNLISDGASWLFTNLVQPFLVTTPISTNASDPGFKVWSTFRVYGDIFLVLALLVVVFGQSIGGGLIDAYTAKKVLPRLLTSAILINLSIYIVAFMVDVTNILGAGIGDLIIGPFKHVGALDFTMSGAQGLGVLGVGILGLFATGGTIIGIVGGLVFGGTAAITGGITAAFFIAIPILLAILGVFVVLVLRKGIILLLVLISPLAFALYCLPNTEKYFKKWWEALVKTLLVYPIVILVFAVADILSITVLAANGTSPADIQAIGSNSANRASLLAIIIAFFLQFLPLFLIPFAFRLAGGMLGNIHQALTGTSGKLSNISKERKEQAKHDFGGHTTQARERGYDALNRRGMGFLARRVGGYNIKGKRAAYNLEQHKIMQAQNDTGDDTEQRALSVNKQWALAHGREGTDWKKDKDGNREFRTLGGRWVDESAVDQAHKRWGGNQAAFQWSLGHEMDKASTQEEQDYLRNNYGNVAQAFNMSAGQRSGVWKGAAFAKQNVNRQWKHYDVNKETGHVQMENKDALSLFREIDEKQGGYQMLQQNADTWTTMSQSMVAARQTLNSSTDVRERARATEILERGARIAYATRSSSMADQTRPGSDDKQPPVPVPGSGGRTVGAGAAGRTQEEMIRFVNFADQTAGQYSPPTAGTPLPTRPAEPLDETLDRRNSDRPGPTPTNTGGTGPREN